MSDDIWHYAKGDQKFGPIAEKKLRELFASGELGPDTLVWARRLTEWTPAVKIEAFRASAAMAGAAKLAPPSDANSQSEPHLKPRPSAPLFRSPISSPNVAADEAPAVPTEYKPKRIALKGAASVATPVATPSHAPASPVPPLLTEPPPILPPSPHAPAVVPTPSVARVEPSKGGEGGGGFWVGLILLLVLGIGAMAIIKAMQPPVWKDFSDDVGGFSASFPSQPRERKEVMQAGGLTLEYYHFQTVRRGCEYEVGYCDYPADRVANADAQALLDSARDGAVSNIRGTLLREENIMLSGHPGKDFSADARGGLVVARSRLFLVSNRLYVIVAVTPRAKADSADVLKFLDSFQLPNP